jgi:DNA-binding transcriptional LysR family regulator
MQPDLDDLVAMAVFSSVADCGSYTEAARRLGLSKSVVSTRVAGLERRLGAKLLHRTTRSVSLTPEGERLHERAREMLRAAREATEIANLVGTVVEGQVRLAAPVGFATFKLAPLISRLLAAHPRLSLRMVLSDVLVDLTAAKIDVAVRFAERLDDSQHVARRLGTDRRVLCASPAYLARKGQPRHPSELAVHDLLEHTTRRDSSEWTLRGPDGAVTVPAEGRVAADNIVVLRTLVLDGAGIGSMPGTVISGDLEAGRVVRVLPDWSFPEVGMFAIHTHGRHPPARVRAVLDFLADNLG